MTSSLVEVKTLVRALENISNGDDEQKQGSVTKVGAKWVPI